MHLVLSLKVKVSGIHLGPLLPWIFRRRDPVLSWICRHMVFTILSFVSKVLNICFWFLQNSRQYKSCNLSFASLIESVTWQIDNQASVNLWRYETDVELIVLNGLLPTSSNSCTCLQHCLPTTNKWVMLTATVNVCFYRFEYNYICRRVVYASI